MMEALMKVEALLGLPEELEVVSGNVVEKGVVVTKRLIERFGLTQGGQE